MVSGLRSVWQLVHEPYLSHLCISVLYMDSQKSETSEKNPFSLSGYGTENLCNLGFSNSVELLKIKLNY